MGRAVGIDLGTIYSRVGVFRNDRLEIIANEQGNPYRPTLSEIQTDIQHWPLKLIDQDSKPVVEVGFKGTTKYFTPEEIPSMILAKLRETAVTYLGETVTDAVNTVPASSSDSQRQATKDAGLIAGFNILRTLTSRLPQLSPMASVERYPIKDGIFAVEFTHGAAVQAAILSGDISSKSIRNILLLEVAPLSLWIETADGVKASIIKRNTTIPTTKSGGVPQIRVTFTVDANGIMEISATEKGPDKPPQIIVPHDKDLPNEKDIERMLLEAK
ncbi:hypothetical protein N7508_011181 [Penicillium antarcticum]|uniref:uncharacterized protein n=1 Tax=Penicillium antarcticum TaxID=416450 RepID=UPI002383C1BD|nr:uncharacterized protein N7508_011181 [Penicillium antarcticum]KAJ5288406.1 hypothetical protein N7508_011181 [Penicillium antarcticum]